MPQTLHELKNLIPADPLNDRLRIELEQLLATTEPNDIELELLQRERQIAERLDSGLSIDEQINEYLQFMTTQSNYFWDMRGNTAHLFRPFSLWLMHCEPSRLFALNVALRNKLNRETAIPSFPIEIVSGKSPDSTYDLKNEIIDFVRRYRGPSGNEPDLREDEIRFVMLATYSQISPEDLK